MILLADISVFVSPNNTEYNIKDATARGWKGAANGTAELDANGKLSSGQIPTSVLLTTNVATTSETQQIITDYGNNANTQ